ncbi:TatD family hydrolase [Brevibacterium paucivorans]|uniref:TatD family hydrolase n=1 Tax=Brevibacterium paucivorans TaxID=170994 RepID=UPI00321C3A4A
MASRAAGEYPPVPEPLAVPAVDTHTHLDMCTGARGPIKSGEPAPEVEPEEDETFPPLDFFYDTAMATGVTRVVQIGCEMGAARWTARVVEEQAQAGRDWMLGGVAIHPNEAPRLARAGILEESLDEIEELVTSHERMRVVGETGLDFFRTDADSARDMKAQEESFRAHIEIAQRNGLTLQIHDREAHADVFRVLRDTGVPDRTILHCFSGDADMAREAGKLGIFCSFAGNVTFKNAHGLREAAEVVPPDLLLTETDAPFLTPHPHRGKPGGPYMVAHVVRTLAQVRGVSEEELAEHVTANAVRAVGEWALSG